MAGYREFQTGEVLTAANVNDFLMEQAVMTFADDAARTSALTDVLREGLLTYNLDTNALERYDGSAWVKVPDEADVDAAGGLVAVKTVLFDGTQTNSTSSGANFSVTNLTITHTLADTSNKLILMGYVGLGASSSQLGSVGIAFADDGTPIGVGTPDPSRTSVGAGGRVTTATNNTITTMPSIHLVYTPSNPADSHTYTLEAFNMDPSTRTIYINRTESDTSAADRGRGVSVLTLMEVKV